MTVLLLIDDPRLADVLVGCGYCCVRETPPGARCDLAIARAGEFPALPKSTGRIALGDDPSADVSLAADFTPRELQIACQLLGQIVRLRRARRKARRIHRTLTAQAHSDPLTGLPNRRAWDTSLAARIEAAKAGGLDIVVAMFDVDRFKEVNSRYGHPIGDRVMQHVGHALTAGVRAGDFVTRLGGDEFGLLLTGVSEHNAAAVIERLRARIGSAPADPEVPAITVSVGYVIVPRSSTLRVELARLIGAADEALRQAKSSGRDCAVQANANAPPSQDSHEPG